MLKTQRWTPDTHPDTVIETQWDTADPDAAHVVLSVAVNGVAQPDPEAAYALIFATNKRKNEAIHEAAQFALPGFVDDVLDENGQPTGVKRFKEANRPDWAVNRQTGKVTLSIKGHPKGALNTARAALADKFGSDVEL